ncbi:MAG: cytidylate kinase-like family protein [Lachnospiraceae bacterium]|nr:cytidylate kinase-like family protein [Lachnospiraceae bacterium]
MSEQLIISIGREFGSGGHVIAEKLAARFGLALYDHNLLDEIAQEKELDAETLKKYDEVPRNMVFSRTVKGFSSSSEENIAHMQFDFLKRKAAAGESFVVVGRCAETMLKDYNGLISIFVLGDIPVKTARVMEVYGLREKEARFKMERHDRHRKMYHNYYCKGKWGDSRNYDLSINSSRLGIERTVDFLESYIKERQK